MSKDKEAPIDPYTGKPSVFLPTDSLVQRAEKGDKGARLMVNTIGFACMGVMLTCVVILIITGYAFVKGLLTGDWYL